MKRKTRPIIGLLICFIFNLFIFLEVRLTIYNKHPIIYAHMQKRFPGKNITITSKIDKRNNVLYDECFEKSAEDIVKLGVSWYWCTVPPVYAIENVIIKLFCPKVRLLTLLTVCVSIIEQFLVHKTIKLARFNICWKMAEITLSF